MKAPTFRFGRPFGSGYAGLGACRLSGHFPPRRAPQRDGTASIPRSESGGGKELVGALRSALDDEKLDKARSLTCRPVPQLSRLDGA